MARMPRLVASGYPHHVTQRESRRQRTFSTDDASPLHRPAIRIGTRGRNRNLAPCLMPDHVHLVMMPSTEDGLRATGPNRSASTIELAGRPLGSAEFIQTLEQKTGKTLAPKHSSPNPYTTS